jgi:hypothetical protein
MKVELSDAQVAALLEILGRDHVREFAEKIGRGVESYEITTLLKKRLVQEYMESDGNAPWQQLSDGEAPGGLCCQRSVGGRCYGHNPDNYDEDGVLK